MKKKLEAELISIAHRVLKLKGREDVIKLHQEAQRITEALAILKFYEDHVALVSKEISEDDFNQKLVATLEGTQENQNLVKTETDTEAVQIITTTESKSVENTDESSEVVENDIITNVEVTKETIKEPTKTQQTSLEDFLMNDYVEPEFVKVENVSKEVTQASDVLFEKIEELNAPRPVSNEVSTESKEEMPSEKTDDSSTDTDKNIENKEEIITETSIEAIVDNEFETILSEREAVIEREKEIPSFEAQPNGNLEVEQNTTTENQLDETIIPKSNHTTYQKQETIAEKVAYKTLSLNDRLTKGISIGLNDRIAFVKNLFGGSNEDYNRVMSQLNTIDNYPETMRFIEHMVKPDYNQWAGKDEYAERFLLAIEKKFL